MTQPELHPITNGSEAAPTALHPDTLLIHAGDEHNLTAAVVPPIWQTSTYKAPSLPEDFSTLASSVNPAHFYSRHGNPTNDQVQAILARLEHTETSLVTASGMGAITAAVLSVVKSGDHIVTQSSLYAATVLLFRNLLSKFDVSVSYVDQTDVAAFEAALQPNTTLIYVETPSNPSMKLTDLAAIARLAKSRGVMTMCDNTFASPVNQRPADFGIDLVLHSATKYLGGHSDLTAGAVCGSEKTVEAAWRTMIITGASLASFDSWLLLRGLRTLNMRVEKSNQNALALAAFLESHPKIAHVFYPGLASHPQHTLAAAQMTGFGGMMSFELAGATEALQFDAAQTVVRETKLATNAVSLGGVETLIVHPASMWSLHYSAAEKKSMGISAGLLRLSVGIEHAGDLIRDFEQALAQIK
ncbi:MAG: PLP-dependent transferase [Rhizobacter sp.]|nr:PLP-dependent transferase [Chlorobiales bacterium]